MAEGEQRRTNILRLCFLLRRNTALFALLPPRQPPKCGRQGSIETPSTNDLTRFDRTRKSKLLTNAEWASLTDPEARIAKMKDGTTHLTYKPEHAVDLDTTAAEIHPADQGDTRTPAGTLKQAEAMSDLMGRTPTPEAPAEMVADKGYHSRVVLKGPGGQRIMLRAGGAAACRCGCTASVMG